MQMRVLVVGTGAVFLLLALSGCEGGVFGVRGSGNVITESRDVSGFSEIALAGSGKVRVDVNGTESLIIEAEDNIMPLLTSEVHDGRLELGAESSISPTTDIIYTVGAIALEGVAISGSGEVTADWLVAADSFDVDISGSGRVEPTGTTDALSRRDLGVRALPRGEPRSLRWHGAGIGERRGGRQRLRRLGCRRQRLG